MNVSETRFRVTERVARAAVVPDAKLTEPEPALTRTLVTVFASPAVPSMRKSLFSYNPGPGEVTAAAGLDREIMNWTGAEPVSRRFGVDTTSGAAMDRRYLPSWVESVRLSPVEPMSMLQG